MQKATWDKNAFRYLSSEQIKTLFELNILHIDVMQVAPKVVVVELATANEMGEGIAICSVKDKKNFSLKIGKKIAFDRAVRALLLKKHSEAMREEFPHTWCPSQVDRVKSISILFDGYKSRFEKM